MCTLYVAFATHMLSQLNVTFSYSLYHTRILMVLLWCISSSWCMCHILVPHPHPISLLLQEINLMHVVCAVTEYIVSI